MEIDFNAANKVVFGHHMLNHARRHDLILDEIYSKQNWLAEDGTLTKVLLYDIVQQARCPAGIAVVNADSCYDRIAHRMGSMAFQLVGVPATATVSVLPMIQDMKFFLRTGYGDSTAFGGTMGDFFAIE